jgi:ribose-phosphate pyrophosphokinase
MKLTILAGRSNRRLAQAVAAALEMDLSPCTVESFPDDEIQVAVPQSLPNHDAYIVQSTNPPVMNHFFELLS